MNCKRAYFVFGSYVHLNDRAKVRSDSAGNLVLAATTSGKIIAESGVSVQGTLWVQGTRDIVSELDTMSRLPNSGSWRVQNGWQIDLQESPALRTFLVWGATDSHAGLTRTISGPFKQGAIFQGAFHAHVKTPTSTPPDARNLLRAFFQASYQCIGEGSPRTIPFSAHNNGDVIQTYGMLELNLRTVWLAQGGTDWNAAMQMPISMVENHILPCDVEGDVTLSFVYSTERFSGSWALQSVGSSATFLALPFRS